MKKILLIVFLIIGLTLPSVLSFGAVRTVTGNEVTIAIDTTDTVAGCIIREAMPTSGLVVTSSSPNGAAYVPNSYLKWIISGSCPTQVTYSTTGSGTVTGKMTSNSIEQVIGGSGVIPSSTCTPTCPLADTICLGTTVTLDSCGGQTCNVVGTKMDEACAPVCTESWSCGSWTDCINEQKTRTCTDENNCGTIVSKPAETESCTIAPTCTDSVQNQDETGVDCGGSCATACVLPACSAECISSSTCQVGTCTFTVDTLKTEIGIAIEDSSLTTKFAKISKIAALLRLYFSLN